MDHPRPAAPPPGTPPLKRHAALAPLSREHMGGLIQARNLTRAADGDREARLGAVEQFIRVWRDEIRGHFDDEERLLLPLTDPPHLRERLLAEHGALRELAGRCESDAAGAAGDPDLLRRLGSLLNEHIRWEERVYFEQIQRDHPQALEAMLAEAQRIEQSRPGSRARRRLDEP